MLVTLDANSTGTTPASTKSNMLNVIATGTWGSGTLSIQIQDNESGEWCTVYSDTTDFAINLITGSGVSYRYILTGATSPDLNIVSINAMSKDIHL